MYIYIYTHVHFRSFPSNPRPSAAPAALRAGVRARAAVEQMAAKQRAEAGDEGIRV